MKNGRLAYRCVLGASMLLLALTAGGCAESSDSADTAAAPEAVAAIPGDDTASAEPTTYPSISAVAAATGGVVLVRDSGMPDNGEALITGNVEMLNGSCVGVRAGATFEVVVWPVGTTFMSAGEGVDVPGYGLLPYGTSIHTAGGGGLLSSLDAGDLLPAGCDATGYVTISDEDYSAR